jgi:hypothetical protein
MAAAISFGVMGSLNFLRAAIEPLLATFIADLFKPPRRLEVENLFLRHQLNIALRRAPQRVRLGQVTVP